jgi:hypothetical protein
MYKTKLKLDNVKFLGTKAEDALNTVYCTVDINNTFISNTISDAYDSDFSEGIVNNMVVTNVKGDALDFSGSQIKIQNSSISYIKDKAISAGEKSFITIENSNISHVGVGLSSKDGSRLTAININIQNASFKDGMAYIKKPFYDNPSLTVISNKKLNTNKYFSQTNCDVIINNDKITYQELDVEKLYKSDIMRKK